MTQRRSVDCYGYVERPTIETQLELEGEYEPPFGAVGAALDAVLGHRIAEASVERLLQEIRRELPPSA